jgi:hypothetical protein
MVTAEVAMRAMMVRLMTMVVVLVSACTPKLIANSNLEDTEENRQVLTLVAKYQAAVIGRSMDALLPLVAADYFEDLGNLDAKDDYNRDGLQQRLTAHFARMKDIDMQIFVQKIDRTNPEKVAVDYRYNSRTLVTLPAGDKWVTSTDVNRLWLRPVGEGDYRIVAGL